jgi:hypothetical protein
VSATVVATDLIRPARVSTVNDSRPTGGLAAVTSLFERALGEQWDDLHPKLRDRYGLVADDDSVTVGRGTMTRLSTGAVAWPVLWLATRQDFVFPESGADVPFEIRTHAALDGRGAEALHLRRHFETSPSRDFVDVLRWNYRDDCLTNVFGRDGYVAANLDLAVEDGGIAIEIGPQWVHVGGRWLRLPDPLAAGGSLRDWYDDYAERYRVAASITNQLAGHLVGYHGGFQTSFEDAPEEFPGKRQLLEMGLPSVG